MLNSLIRTLITIGAIALIIFKGLEVIEETPLGKKIKLLLNKKKKTREKVSKEV